MIKVLMISKACVVGNYQRKLEHIGNHPDVDLTVAVPSHWKDERGTLYLERKHENGYRLVVEPIVFNGSFHTHFYPKIGRLIASIEPDIVHIDEEPYNLATWHILRLAKRHNARTVFFSWQNIARSYPRPFRNMEAYVLREADLAICGSHSCRTVLLKKGYRGTAAIIPQFGVDPDLFPWREPRLDIGLAITIGYIGRLVPEKGVDLLLNAIAGMDENVNLRLIGAGPEYHNLQRTAAELGIVDRVEFIPWLDSENIPIQLRHMDALVLPSRTQSNWKEQFGRVLLEAMATGVPVIGSNCGEIPNVIGDAGLVFTEGDQTALTAALLKLTTNPALRQELAERGRTRMLTKYTQTQVAAETVRVYRDLMRDRMTPR